MAGGEYLFKAGRPPAKHRTFLLVETPVTIVLVVMEYHLPDP